MPWIISPIVIQVFNVLYQFLALKKILRKTSSIHGYAR
ncbi:hypothetical protein CSC35_1511 [Enterobacter hormaechei]|nr:hypothetical protein CSC35_1511 [Enterobacter hormaechei]